MAIFTTPQVQPIGGTGIFTPGSIAPKTTTPIFGLGMPQSSLEATAINYGGTSLGMYMQQKQMEQLMAAGFPSLDPDLLESQLNTPEVQRQANETALAQIAAANPALAQELIARQNEEGKDQSLWDNIKDLGGDLLGGVGKLGMGLLELITRPAQIIPELIVDKENDAWYEDIAQALAGNSTARGADVMEQVFGSKGWGKAVGGFAFDVLADPITWLTFGTAGLGRRIASEAGGRLVAQKTLADLVGKTGKLSADELSTLIKDFGRRLTDVGMTKYNPDALPALVAQGITDLGDDAILEAINVATLRGQNFAQAIGQGVQIRRVAGFSGERDILRSLTKNPDELLDILRTNTPGAQRQLQRQAASALGGMRLRAAVPFTKHRVGWVSGAFPGTEGLNLFGPVSNFFRGTSGMTRLRQLITSNPQISEKQATAMMTSWVEGGFKQFAHDYPDHLKALGGNTLSMGGSLWTASARMGRLTSKVIPHAMLLRHGGLAGHAAINASTAYRTLERSLYEAGRQLTDDVDELTGAVRPAVNRVDYINQLKPLRDLPEGRNYDVIEMAELISGRSMAVADDDTFLGAVNRGAKLRHQEVLNDIDADEASGRISALQAQNKRDAAAKHLAAADDEAKRRLERVRELWPTFNEDEQNAIEVVARSLRQTLDRGNRNGEGIAARNVPVRAVGDLTPDDMVNYNPGARSDLNGVAPDDFIEGQQAVAGRGGKLYAPLRHGFPTAEDVGTNTSIGVRGISVTIDAGEDAVRVGMDARKPIVLREGKKLEGDNALWDQWTQENAAIFEDPDLKLSFLNDNPHLADDPEAWEVFKAEKIAEANTQRAIKEKYDAVVRYDADDNVVEAVYLWNTEKNHNPIWRIDPDAEAVLPNGGYFPFMMTPELIEAMRGAKINVDEVYPGGLMHAKERKTGETWRQLNERLKEKFGVRGDALEGNILLALDDYNKHVAQGAARTAIGFAHKRIAGLYAGSVPEMVTWLNKYSVDKGFLTTTQLARLGDKARQSYEKSGKRADRALKDVEKVQQLKTQREQLIYHQIIFGEGGTHVAAASRAVRAGQFKAGVTIGRQFKETQLRIANLKLKLKKAPDDAKLLSQLEETESLRESLAAMKESYGSGYVPKNVEEALLTLGVRAEKQLQKVDAALIRREELARKSAMLVEDTNNSLNQIRTRLESHMAVPTPAIVTDATKTGYVELGQIQSELRGMFAHPYIAEELASALKGRHISTMQKEWRRWVNGPWKAMATIYFPGFHVRNHMGAWFNGWLGGTTLEHYWIAHRISRAHIPKSKWYKAPLKDAERYGLPKGTTYTDLYYGAHDHGFTGSYSLPFADTGRAVSEVRKALRKPKTPLGRGAEVLGEKIPVPRAARWASETSENFHRRAAMMRGLELTGGNWWQARSFTMMRHGDYDELTDLEEKIKDLVPFYKWMRTNTPFQIRQLLENPGKQLGTLKGFDAAMVAAGQDPDEFRAKVPDWMERTLAFPLGSLKGFGDNAVLSTLAVDLPLADLFNGANDYMAAFLPVVRPLFENKLGVHVWTGAPITGKQVKVHEWMTLPGLRQLFSPLITEDAQGNATMDDRTLNILSAIPVFSRFRPWILGDDDNVENRMNSVYSALTGLRPRDVNQDTLTKAEKEFFYDHIQPVITELKDLGVSLPAPGQLSPALYSYLGFTPPEKETV